MAESLAEQKKESKRLRLEEIDANADKIVQGKLNPRGKKKKKNLKRKRDDDDDGDGLIVDEDKDAGVESSTMFCEK